MLNYELKERKHSEQSNQTQCNEKLLSEKKSLKPTTKMEGKKEREKEKNTIHRSCFDA